MSATDRLSLIQWLSPGFPTGGFAYSHGLEQAMADGLRDPEAVADWVSHVLARGGGWTDAVILSQVLRGEDADELADLARAMAGSAERLIETMDQGRAFAATVAALTGRDMPPRPLPVAVGATWRVVRSNSGAPTICSSFWMRRVSAGWEMFSFSAAL